MVMGAPAAVAGGAKSGAAFCAPVPEAAERAALQAATIFGSTCGSGLLTFLGRLDPRTGKDENIPIGSPVPGVVWEVGVKIGDKVKQWDPLFRLDDREVKAPENAMLVDAAKHGDVEIPVFCYEPKLGQPVGACRPYPASKIRMTRRRSGIDCGAWIIRGRRSRRR